MILTSYGYIKRAVIMRDDEAHTLSEEEENIIQSYLDETCDASALPKCAMALEGVSEGALITSVREE